MTVREDLGMREPPGLDDESRRLGERVRAFMRSPDPDAFDGLACDIFDVQRARVPALARFCTRRGVGAVTSWHDIPALPVAAFKTEDLTCRPPAMTFRTSGTSRGIGARGRHLVADPTLYAESVVRGVRRFVVPDAETLRVVSLIPPPQVNPESSLSHMADLVMGEVDDGHGVWMVDDAGLDADAVLDVLERIRDEGMPVLLFATTLALVPVLEAATARDTTLRLPDGSRLVDTGGSKGSGREFDDARLVDAYVRVFGIPAERCQNEYGMTELLSQYYSHVDSRSPGSDRRTKVSPPWLRPRVLDPDTMTDVAVGERGLVAHVDLANCHSIVSIVTDDVGERVDEQRVRLLGRRAGAVTRGCSIAMDEWLR